jgi:prepilin-type N-terminal cleavage/methylation domain-containing protein
MRTKSSGFSLMEVLIAICVFAFALLAMAQLQIVAIRGNSFANRLTTEATLAQDKLEEIMGLPYANLVNGQDNRGQYARVWTVLDDTPGAGMKTVAVTVSSQDGETVQLQTIIGND